MWPLNQISPLQVESFRSSSSMQDLKIEPGFNHLMMCSTWTPAECKEAYQLTTHDGEWKEGCIERQSNERCSHISCVRGFHKDHSNFHDRSMARSCSNRVSSTALRKVSFIARFFALLSLVAGHQQFWVLSPHQACHTHLPKWSAPMNLSKSLHS